MRVVSLDAFKESLVEELGNKVAFTVPVLGGVPVAESVVVTWIVMAALIALALALTRRLSVDRPGKVQCALEWTVEFLNGFVKTNIGAHWRPFAPWLGTVALYIGLSNLIGVFGLTPPTKDISVTAALALMSMFLIYGAQFRYNGLAGGLKKFAEPMPLLIPINLMEVAIRPLALCMRLFWAPSSSWRCSSCWCRWCCRRCSASTSTCLTGSFRPSSLCSSPPCLPVRASRRKTKSIDFRRKSL